VTNENLIEKAATVLNPYTTKDGRLFGDVGAALISDHDKVYVGVCVDTASWGLCAERSAIAAMITDKNYKIKKIVAVWRDEKDGKLYVLPPCGVCREIMRRIDEDNLETEMILGRKDVLKLKELIPRYEWPKPLD
jgi:cytidine deaminase